MEIFRIENINFLWGLLSIPILLILFILWRIDRMKKLQTFGDMGLISKLIPQSSKYKPTLKYLLLMLSLLFLVIGISNPQIGSRLVEFKREGVDVVLSIDVSNSMKAQDIKPDRLSRAKLMVSRMIDKMMNDRISIVIFAGDAFLQLPLTSDYSAAKLMLQTIDTDLISGQGTAIGKSIELAIGAFPDDQNRNKAIIVITDGENHEDDALGMAKEAAAKGIYVHTIGMGTVNGGPIPNKKPGGQDFLRDYQGNTIITKLDATMLQQIASAGNGTFVRAMDTDPAINDLLAELAKMEKQEFGSKLYSDYEDKFQYFLAIAIFFLVMEFIISDRKNKYISSLMSFVEKK